MNKTFYEKVGIHYVPVREYDSDLMDSFPGGTHLVVCKPGCKSYKYNVDPMFAPMLAAGSFALDAMSSAIVKGLEHRAPETLKLNERQIALWKELNESFAEQDFVVHGPSALDAAQEGLKVLNREVEKMLEVPAVKLAYEQFMLTWKLTKDRYEEDK